MRRRARLAAPFVVTIAALPACGSGAEDIHRNPPALPEPAHNPPAIETPPTATAAGSAAPSATPTAKVAGDLPPATNPEKVRRREDGTCWEFHDMHCPPQATCNPPPPRQVACPEKR
jgi:hypothetical protein